MRLYHFTGGIVLKVMYLVNMTPYNPAITSTISGLLCCSAAVASVAEPLDARRNFDLPKGDAASMLTRFAEISGRPIVFMVDKVRGERTNAVEGTFTASEALARMLAGTALVARHDDATGGYLISRNASAPAPAKKPPQPKRQATSGERKAKSGRTVLSILHAMVALAIGGNGLAGADTAQGTVEGRVYNATNGMALANARVSIAGTTHETTTDATGAFRLGGLPSGTANVVISYLGMQPLTATVEIASGDTVHREFELRLLGSARKETSDETIVLESFNVVADREMSAQAIAMNEQRNAPNIKNVVSIDEFGDRGKGNIGEFLLFLPGVSIATGGSEPSTVSLRGFPASSSPIMVDGSDVAVSWNANSRQSVLYGVPMANVSRVEITKVPTPDMPATGLGGSINLISRSGFESRTRKLDFNAYTIFHSFNGLTFDGGRRNHVEGTSPKYVEPSFDFSYVEPLRKNLAITVGGGREWKLIPMNSGNLTDEQPVWDRVRLVQTSSEWTSIAAVRKVTSGHLGVDWQVTPRDSVSANLQYRVHDLYQTRSVMTWNYGAGATGGPDYTQGAATAVGNVEMRTGDNIHFDSDTVHGTLKYRHRGSRWDFDAAGYYSTSGTKRSDIDEGHFARVPATFGSLVLRGEGIPSSGGYIPTRYTATTRTGQSVDVYDGANYSITNGDSRQVDWGVDKSGARLDLVRHFSTAGLVAIKVGSAVDRLERDERSFTRTWQFRPNGLSDAESRLAGRFDVFDTAFNDDSADIFGKQARWISAQKLFDLFRSQPTWFVEDPAASHQNLASNSRKFSETVSAGYLRADVRLLRQRLWLVAGVRYERTDAEGRGPLNDINAQYQRRPDGSFVTNAQGQRVLITNDALALRKLRYVERGAHAERTYDGWYPSLNATYNISEKLVARAGYARTLGRPNISNIVPGTNVSAPDVVNPSITVNNTGLQPWIADGFDLSLESYLFKDGFGSAGVFRKEVKNFFGASRVRATPELLEQYGLENDTALLGYDIVTRENVGEASIEGFEIGYRQSLTFLPVWARGLQVFANYTKLSLGGDRTADFSDFNPENIAAGINFIRPRFYIKATISHLGNIRLGPVAASATVPPDTYEYQLKRTRIGLNAQYSLSKRYAVYASVMDLGGFVQDLQRFAPNTPEYARGHRLQELGYNIYAGVRGSF